VERRVRDELEGEGVVLGWGGRGGRGADGLGGLRGLMPPGKSHKSQKRGVPEKEGTFGGKGKIV